MVTQFFFFYNWICNIFAFYYFYYYFYYYINYRFERKLETSIDSVLSIRSKGDKLIKPDIISGAYAQIFNKMTVYTLFDEWAFYY